MSVDVSPLWRAPVRERSLNGVPKPTTSISRTCVSCGAGFSESCFADQTARGIWHEWRWFCSRECEARS